MAKAMAMAMTKAMAMSLVFLVKVSSETSAPTRTSYFCHKSGLLQIMAVSRIIRNPVIRMVM